MSQGETEAPIFPLDTDGDVCLGDPEQIKDSASPAEHHKLSEVCNSA